MAVSFSLSLPLSSSLSRTQRLPSPHFAILDTLSDELKSILIHVSKEYSDPNHVELSRDFDAKHNSGQLSDAYLVVDALNKHGLHSIFAESSLAQRLPHDAQRLLMARVSLSVAATELQTNAFDSVLNAFAAEQVSPPIVFKGAALGALDYKKPWHRPKTDFDLLIKASDKSAYHSILLEQGFVQKTAISGKYISYQDSYFKQVGDAAHIWIDLHWKVSNRLLLASLLSYDTLRESARLYASGRAKEAESSAFALAPSRVDSIVLAAQHIVGHHSQDSRLLWFFDLHLLLSQCNEQEVDELIEQCGQLKIVGLVFAVLEHTQTLFDADLHQNLLEPLSELAKDAEPSRRLVEIKHTRFRLIWWDLCAIKSITGKFCFIYENVIPDRTYMQARFTARWLFVSHLKRWFGIQHKTM